MQQLLQLLTMEPTHTMPWEPMITSMIFGQITPLRRLHPQEILTLEWGTRWRH